MRRYLLSILLVLSMAVFGFSQQSTGDAKGQITANSASCTSTTCVELRIPTNAGTIMILVTGTFTATLEVEGTADGETWTNGLLANPLPNGAAATDFTAAGVWRLPAAGWKSVRIRCSAYTDGTAVVTLFAVPTIPFALATA